MVILRSLGIGLHMASLFTLTATTVISITQLGIAVTSLNANNPLLQFQTIF